MPHPVNIQQQRFIKEYLVDLNGKQAAIRAGYTARSAEVTASKLLRLPKVKDALAAARKKLEYRTELNAEYVLSRLKKIAERCLQERPIMEFDKEERAYRQKLDEETGEPLFDFDSSGANKALELIGKHLALFTEKVEHSGEIKGPAISTIVVRGVAK